MTGNVTVITLTRGRLALLERAIASVQRQDYADQIEHRIIIDDCPVTLEAMRREEWPDNVTWRFFSRNPGQQSGPARVADLRNRAVQISTSEYVSFLDDDNEFEARHISSLVACMMRTGCSAVHSHMQVFWKDGRPYLEPRMPWFRDPEEGKRAYDELCAKGVVQFGSNVFRDRVDPCGYPDPVRTVDTGEWLFKRELLIKHPFCTDYTIDDWKSITTEDDKLMDALVKNGISISCTGLPTLKYYLGGYSNSFESGVSDELANRGGKWV
jgi:glycosyltransferase involved in cell wall biosynthesis